MSYSIKYIDATRESVDELVAALGTRGKMALAPVVEAVETILEEVRTAGDAALLAFTRKYDGAELTPETMKVTEAEIRAATQVLDDQVLADLKAAADRIELFAKNKWSTGRPPFA